MKPPLEPEALPEPNPCFADSRRLTGHNRFFAGTGVVLETLGPTAQDAAVHERWRDGVCSLRQALGWDEAPPIVRSHASGTLLAFAAPTDALFTATEVNEWAWERASGIFAPDSHVSMEPPFDQLHTLGNDFSGVVTAFRARGTTEANPALTALRAAAKAHRIPILADDQMVSLGAGGGSLSWSLTNLPDPDSIAWSGLHDIPKVLVTGSNGKTTTVRLLAALIDASDARYRDHVGYSSTEGVVIGDTVAGEGDFSGPAGARLVLRDARVETAVLETARGGILRRGLAVEEAEVAVVTNISADHFGEYGIDSLDDLADVKLVVRHALGKAGTLVLNADDPVLLARAADQICKVALFAFDDAHPALLASRQVGGATCGLVDEQLWLTHHGARSLLGSVRAMPLTANCAAMYNVANIAAAVLAASALGVSPQVIGEVLNRFGSRREDNPGRLERWLLGDITVLVDYAHNPQGIASLMVGCKSIQSDQLSRGGAEGRIGLLLGQAGNRSDVAIADLARATIDFQPDVIVIKEIASMLRGRAMGEVPALLKASLLAAGYPRENIQTETDEVDAARYLLRWAQAGDVLVLPIHQSASRKALSGLLDRMEKERWRAGAALPAASVTGVPTGTR